MDLRAATPEALTHYVDSILEAGRASFDARVRDDFEVWLMTEGPGLMRAMSKTIKMQMDTTLGPQVPSDLRDRDYGADTVEDVIASLRKLVWLLTSQRGSFTVLPVDWTNVARAAMLLDRYVPSDDRTMPAPRTWIGDDGAHQGGSL
jgi:hypothetical protein